MMSADLLGEIFGAFDSASLALYALRLLAALALGGLIGWDRGSQHHAAGLRTQMLVCLGAATFMLLAREIAGPAGDPTRVLQGVAMGIGFLGGGTILKLPSENRVRGLTTAASIWATAAIGVAAGCGRVLLALVMSVLTILVLRLFKHLEPVN